MTGETTITLSLAALLIAGLSALWFRIETMLSDEREARQDVADDLAAFQLECVRTFATAGAIEKSEERLALALDRVTARLEAVIGRIEALSIEMARVVKPNSHRGPSP